MSGVIMKKSKFSPDRFMNDLYSHIPSRPYENAVNSYDVAEIGKEIKAKTKEVLGIDRIPLKFDKIEKLLEIL